MKYDPNEKEYFLKAIYNKKYLRFLRRLFKKSQIEKSNVGCFVITALCTGVIMWLYALIEIFYMDCYLPAILGILSCVLHSFTIILLMFSFKYSLIVHYILATCVFHQIIFSFFSGGADNNLLVWLSFMPVLAGLNINFKAALVWGINSIIISIILIYFNTSTDMIKNHLHPDGLFFSRFILHFGFIIFCTLLTYFYVSNLERDQKIIQKQSEKVENLFKVLFHDLANPITKIGLGLHLIKKNKSSSIVDRSIGIIDESYQTMFNITQNVRKMYAISKGKQTLELSFIPFNECVDFVLEQFNQDLESKNITLKYDFEKCLGFQVLVDPVSFKHQVISNLITNAIKFSHKNGSIHIQVRHLRDHVFSIDISDQGIGIPKELIPHLFKRESQTNRQGTSNENGTGFGLIIMKSFMELYGGSVNVVSRTSEDNHQSGTTFSLILEGRLV
jgi:signal transduction histidine kinase